MSMEASGLQSVQVQTAAADPALPAPLESLPATARRLGPDVNKRFNRLRKRYTQVLDYASRLAGCTAGLAGSLAMLKYAGKLLPSAPWLPWSVGTASFLAFMALTVWTAMDGYARIPSKGMSFFARAAIAYLIWVPSLFFAMAGVFLALK